MNSKELCIYLIDQMKELVLSQPSSDDFTKILSDSYIRLSTSSSVCIQSSSEKEIDSSLLVAIGTMIYMAKKEISH